MKFHNYRSTILANSKTSGLSIRETIGAMVKDIGRDHRRSARAREDLMYALKAEATYYESGQPYYKVWPNMIEAMTRVSLDVPGEAFALPYRGFVIRLPTGDHALRTKGVLCAAILVGTVWRGEPISIQTITYGTVVVDGLLDITYQFTNGSATRTSYGIQNDTSLEEQLHLWTAGCPSDELAATFETTPEFKRKLLAVILATSLFGTNRHELVMPDVPRDEITIVGRGKRGKALRQMRKPVQTKGWKVGSEIDLPRPLIKYLKRSSGGGTELECGHIRSGHMRMQPCGKDNKDRKLIFVAPMLIRPDLPMRTTHGYRIQDKVLA